MSTRARAMVVTRWVAGDDGSYVADLAARVATLDNDSFTVAVADADPARLLAQDTNVTLVQFDGDPATLDALALLPDALVLGAETYDEETGEVVSSNWDAPLDSSSKESSDEALDAVVGKGAAAIFKQDGKDDVFREGMTRQQALEDVADVIGKLDGALVTGEDAAEVRGDRR